MGRRALLISSLLILLLMASAGRASAACTDPHHYEVGRGPEPTGGTWAVTAFVRNNGSCREWLFDLEFALGQFGNAGSATGIPAGGHIPPEYFLLDANDLISEDGTERVFYGYTDREGAKIVANLRNGEDVLIRPQRPPKNLRQSVVLMRGFRFFVYFGAYTSPIERVSVYTRAGRLMYRTRSTDGSTFY